MSFFLSAAHGRGAGGVRATGLDSGAAILAAKIDPTECSKSNAADPTNKAALVKGFGPCEDDAVDDGNAEIAAVRRPPSSMSQRAPSEWPTSSRTA